MGRWLKGWVWWLGWGGVVREKIVWSVDWPLLDCVTLSLFGCAASRLYAVRLMFGIFCLLSCSLICLLACLGVLLLGCWCRVLAGFCRTIRLLWNERRGLAFVRCGV